MHVQLNLKICIYKLEQTLETELFESIYESVGEVGPVNNSLKRNLKIFFII